MTGAASRIGLGDVRAAQQRVDPLPQLAVEQVGHAAAGAAVADDVLVPLPTVGHFGLVARPGAVLVHGAMDKNHLPHPQAAALGDDPLGLLFVDGAVLLGEGAGPGLDAGADHNVGLQRVVAGAVCRPAAAGADGDGPLLGIDQAQDLGAGQGASGVPRIAKGGGDAPTQHGPHRADRPQAPVAAPQEVVAPIQERHLQVAGKEAEAPATKAAMFAGDGVDE